MHTPKVSVIVCTYNQEGTIARTLDSILNQRVDFDYEIILADDCSKDNTPKICQKYASRYPDIIKLYLNAKNKGITDNYYDCLEACRGQYIADLAGDDKWTDSEKLAKQVRIMDSDSSIGLCHAGWRAVYPDGAQAPTYKFHIPDRLTVSEPGEHTIALLNRQKEKYFIHLCTALYRRDVITSIIKRYPRLFRDKHLTSEDLQLCVMMSYESKIAYLPDIVLDYTVGAPSISSDENILKTISFYAGTIWLIKELIPIVSNDRSVADRSLEKLMQFLITKYFYGYSPDGRNLVRDIIRNMNTPMNLKSKILLRLSSNNLTWSMTNRLRKIFKNQS